MSALSIVKRGWYSIKKEVETMLVRAPIFLIRGSIGFVLFVANQLFIRIYSAIRIFYGACRQGPVVLMLKVVRRVPFAAFSWIESAYFTFARARDLTYEDLASGTLFVEITDKGAPGRNFFIYLSRALREFRDGQHEECSLISGQDSFLLRLRTQLSRRYGGSDFLELNVLAKEPFVDFSLIQNIAQMSGETVKDYALYLDCEEFCNDLPVLLPESKGLEAESPDQHICADINSLSADWVISHFVDRCGTELKPAGTSITNASNALIPYVTSQSIIVVNVNNGGISDIDSFHREWAPVLEALSNIGFKRGNTTIVVINSALGSGKFSHSCFDSTILSSMLGLSYTDIIALIDSADCYIGTYDHYGVSLPGRSTAAILFPDESDEPLRAHPSKIETLGGSRVVRNGSKNQFLFLDSPSPEQLANIIDLTKDLLWHQM